MSLLLLLFFCAGCAGQIEAPSVELYVADADQAEALAGAEVWKGLGFEVTVADDTPPRQCPRHWYDAGDVDCGISVVIERAAATDDILGPNVLGAAIPELRTVWVVDTAADDVYQRIVAHEVGHVLLDTGAHLEAGAGGVMASSSPTDALTWADHELACDAVGLCR